MYHVVLAGGRGTRFWPVSRADRPKQLVRLWSDQSMLQATAARLRSAPNHEGLFVLAPDALRAEIFEQLPDLPDSHFITQPAPRGTLPAIALVAAAIDTIDENATVGIFPADHYIGDIDSFHECLRSAEQHAEDGAIVTLGIEPSRPETEYGYIRKEATPIDLHEDDGRTEKALPAAYPVKKFEEKPDEATAREYLKTGDVLWNSGMFFARTSDIFRELRDVMPEARAAAETLRESFESECHNPDLRAFHDIPDGSFDSDIVERADQVRVIPADIDWSDVGQWSSIDAVFGRDEDGNTIHADRCLLSECSETVVFDSQSPDSRLITGVDLDGLVLVQTEDALLVCPRHSAHRVRDIYSRIEDDEARSDLLHKDRS